MEHLVLKLNESHRIANNGLNWSQSIPYDQGSVGGLVQFLLICRNIPEGTIIGFSSDTPGPVPPIYLPPTIVSMTSAFVAGLVSDVPANYQGIFTYYVDFKQQPPPDANIDFQASFVPAG